MHIFDREPGDWRELQAMTGQLFTEIGCEVKVGKRLEIVRGTKEIDVYARDNHATPPAVYLSECKFWKRPVPQEIVHAFRTVVSDAGAHRGFIISNAGFQQGAFEAARNTNTDLVTFTQLQEMFFDRWRVAMGETIYAVCGSTFPLLGFSRKNAALPMAERSRATATTTNGGISTAHSFGAAFAHATFCKNVADCAACSRFVRNASWRRSYQLISTAL